MGTGGAGGVEIKGERVREKERAIKGYCTDKRKSPAELGQ